jgi:hypothetical protein
MITTPFVITIITYLEQNILAKSDARSSISLAAAVPAD